MVNKDDGFDIQEEARHRKAKRARRKIIVIIIVIVALVAAVVGGFIAYSSLHPAGEAETASGGAAIDQEQVADASHGVGSAITSVPDLSSYFGMTTDEVLADLGSSATLLSTSPATDADSAAIVQLADIQIAPDPDSGSSEQKAAELYLGLDESGHVIKVYYSVSLDNLGNGDLSFEALLKDTEFTKDVLSDAGTGVKDFDAELPDESQYAENTTDSDGKQVLSRCTYTFSGNTTLTTPQTWQVTYTYDYVTGTVASSSDVVRIMYVKLL